MDLLMGAGCMISNLCFRVKKLTHGVEYHFRVAAENRLGISQFAESPSAIAKDPYGKFFVISEFVWM